LTKRGVKGHQEKLIQVMDIGRRFRCILGYICRKFSVFPLLYYYILRHKHQIIQHLLNQLCDIIIL
jgi:hypothetical protein